MVRWALRLDEFDMTLESRPGIKMPHVDTLSRYPVQAVDTDEVAMDVDGSQEAEEMAPEGEEDTTPPQSAMRWHQKQDAECQMLYRAIRHGRPVYAHLRRLIEGGQMHINEGTLQYRSEARDVPFVPLVLRDKLITEYHEGNCACTPRFEKGLRGFKEEVLLALDERRCGSLCP